jgi:hypothetical protein
MAINFVKPNKTIIKRVYPQYFQEILTGVKNYEVRLGNFKAQVGDTLHLKEYDPELGYTGRELKREIVNLIYTNDLKFWAKQKRDRYGFAIMGLREPNDGSSQEEVQTEG